MIISHPLEASNLHRRSNALRWFVGVVLSGAALFALLLVQSERADASSCAGPLAGGEIRVVIVVDGADSGGGSSATCLVVPAGTTGSQLLARRSAELRTGSPRYGSSGLLCAIDGLPATGCGDRNAGGFAYWAYFDGASGDWSYGDINPFAKRLSDGDIEGWRYVRGAGNGQDPPPRIAPSGSLFPALAPAPSPPPDSPSATPIPAGGAGAPSSAVAGGTNSAIAGESPDVGASSSAAEGSVASSATTSVEPVVVDAVAFASSISDSSTTGRWIGIVAVAVLIFVMAGGAWFKTRRSR